LGTIRERRGRDRAAGAAAEDKDKDEDKGDRCTSRESKRSVEGRKRGSLVSLFPDLRRGSYASSEDGRRSGEEGWSPNCDELRRRRWMGMGVWMRRMRMIGGSLMKRSVGIVGLETRIRMRRVGGSPNAVYEDYGMVCMMRGVT